MGNPEPAKAILYRAVRVDPASPEQNRRLFLEEPSPCTLEILAEERDSPPEPDFSQHEAVLEAWRVSASSKDSARWRDALRSWITAAADATGTSIVSVRAGEMQIQWIPGHAVVFAPDSQAQEAWEVLLDFAHLEEELRRMEAGIRAAWPGLEQDTPLAYDAHKQALARDPEIAHRARTALLWRMTFSRLDPLLNSVPARFSPPASQLAEALREAARCEDRLQYADAQIEVHESVYEMASQRLGEFRNTQSTFFTEAIIIVLLAAEVLLMLWDALRK